jgi:hypothetical protein
MEAQMDKHGFIVGKRRASGCFAHRNCASDQFFKMSV